MKSTVKVQSQIFDLPVYQPGKPIEAVAREHNLSLDSICKLASNENPLGPSPHAVAAMTDALHSCHYYPDGNCTRLRSALAARFELEPQQFIFGNGSNDLIELLAHVFIGKGVEAVMGQHSFPVYRIVTELMGGNAVMVPMPDFKHDLNALLAAINEHTRVVFLPAINNPTGTSNSADEIHEFMEKLPSHVVLLFDEAYSDYIHGGADMVSFVKAGKPVLCTRTFSKFYGLAGLRIGYGYATQEMVDLLNRARQPFNVNHLAQVAALASLDDLRYLKQTREINRMGLMQLYSGFEALGLSFTPSDGNFVLVQVPEAQKAFDFLQKRGVIVRPILSMGDYLRVSVGLEIHNHALLKGIEVWLDQLNPQKKDNPSPNEAPKAPGHV